MPEKQVSGTAAAKEEPWFVFISADLEVASAADFKYKQITSTIRILSYYPCLQFYLENICGPNCRERPRLFWWLATGPCLQFTRSQVSSWSWSSTQHHNAVPSPQHFNITLSGPGAGGSVGEEETQLKYPRDQEGYENTESSGPHEILLNRQILVFTFSGKKPNAVVEFGRQKPG